MSRWSKWMKKEAKKRRAVKPVIPGKTVSCSCDACRYHKTHPPVSAAAEEARKALRGE